MMNLEALIQDVAQKRGALKGGGGDSSAEYAEVWNCYMNYLRACLEQRRGLVLGSFCKVGWQLDPKRRQASKVQCRPFFQLTEQFCRTCLSQEATRRVVSGVGAGELSMFEDFNFSKAAIKFSQSLTKDQVFSGLRAIVQRLGELISDGREVDIVFGDIGRLVVRGGNEPRFNFSAELYAIEGIEPPPGALDEGQLRGSSSAPAFTKTAPKEAQGLGIRGSAAPLEVSQPPPPEPEPQQSTQVLRVAEPEMQPMTMEESGDDIARPPSMGSVEERSPTLSNQQYKREIVYKKAMDRHIGAMEARAVEAVNEADAWQQHVSDCMSQERDELSQKRDRAQMNLHFLQHQMNLSEEKRKEQRREDIVAASAHDFPKFKQAEDSEKKEFALGQQARMRKDLDEQVRTNTTLRNIAKQRERALEINQLQANREEMAMLRGAERAKKAYDREALATAWNSDIRMKNVWKAIDNHKAASQITKTGPNDLPPSRGGSTLSAGRIMTGSSRRVPLGASHSLGQLETRLSNGQ